MCGAFAISAPSAANSAHEKSRRSLMLTECAVCSSTMPISSATCMKRLLNTSSMIGSASRPSDSRRARRPMRVSSNVPVACTSARQPGSTMVVAFGSTISAGPGEARAGRQLRAVVDGDVAPAVAAPDVAARDRLHAAPAAPAAGAAAGGVVGPGNHGFELERLDDERGVRADAKAEMPLVQRAERRRELRDGSSRRCHATGKRRIGSGDFDEHAPLEPRRRAASAPCSRSASSALARERLEAGRQRRARAGVERRFDARSGAARARRPHRCRRRTARRPADE